MAATGVSMIMILAILVAVLGGRGGKIATMVLAAAVLLFTNRYGASSSASAPAQEYVPEEENSAEEAPAAEAAEAASEEEWDLPSLPDTFYFSSGAGGWATELYFDGGGYVRGVYHDSDMGDSGEDYDATIYLCNFNAKFRLNEKIDEYTYSLQLEWIEQAETPGETWIEDRVRYIGAGPYGMDDGGEFLLYLPGRPTDDLTEECISWIYMAEGWNWDERGSNLSCYVLYNVNAGEAFTGR